MVNDTAGKEKPTEPQWAGATKRLEEAKSVCSSNEGESARCSSEKWSAEETAADLPRKPTEISKFGFATSSHITKKASVISIKLWLGKPKETFPTLAPKPSQ